MKRTWLIQRLNKPHPNGLLNVFEFGGGLLRGGLDEKAYEALNQFVSFDYMGSAEFEFGALVESLNEIIKYVQSKDYANGVFKSGSKEIYVLCRNSEKEEVKKTIEQLSKDELRLKEPCRLKRSLEGQEKHIGWIELDNDFMFFIDKTAYDGVMSLFGLKLHD